MTRRDLAILRDEIRDVLKENIRDILHTPSKKNPLLNSPGKTAKKEVFGAVIHDVTMSDEDGAVDADTEEDGGDSPVCKKRKPHSPVKHRTERVNAFHVRLH